MADVGGGPPSITLLQALLTFSGVLLAPVVGTIVGLLSRSDLQRRHQEAEFNIKRLELIDKSINVGKTLSNALGIQIDISLARNEYTRVLNSLSPPVPPQDLLPFERHWFPLRLVMLPRPTSIGGWIASFFFYIYVATAVLTIPLYFQERLSLPPASSSPEAIELYNTQGELLRRYTITMLASSLVIAAAARFGAIRAAKAAARRERERLLRETDSSRLDGARVQTS